MSAGGSPVCSASGSASGIVSANVPQLVPVANAMSEAVTKSAVAVSRGSRAALTIEAVPRELVFAE